MEGEPGGVMEGKSGLEDEGLDEVVGEAVGLSVCFVVISVCFVVVSVCFVVVGGGTGAVVFFLVVVVGGGSSFPGFGIVVTPPPLKQISPFGQQPSTTQYCLRSKVSFGVNIIPKSILTLEDNRHQQLKKGKGNSSSEASETK